MGMGLQRRAKGLRDADDAGPSGIVAFGARRRQRRVNLGIVLEYFREPEVEELHAPPGVILTFAGFKSR